jgi:hypothetical protein
MLIFFKNHQSVKKLVEEGCTVGRYDYITNLISLRYKECRVIILRGGRDFGMPRKRSKDALNLTLKE